MTNSLLQPRRHILTRQSNATFSNTGVCGTSENPYPAAILHYDGASDDLPTDVGTTPEDSYCSDSLDYVPVVENIAPNDEFYVDGPAEALNITQNNTVSRVFWPVNGDSINVTWGKPTLRFVQDDDLTNDVLSNAITIPGTSQVRTGHPLVHVLYND